MTAVPLAMTPPTGDPVAVPPATGPAFALHVTVDPSAGPMAASLLADVARRVLAVVEESGPLTWSRSLLSPDAPRSSGAMVPGPSTGAADGPTATGGPVAPAVALVVDAGAREVTRRGVVVPLTYKELGLLEHLLRNPHRAVPRDELLREVWRKDVTARTTRTVDVHVRRLREKLGGFLRIVTVRGVGYRWDPTPEVVLVGSGDAD